MVFAVPWPRTLTVSGRQSEAISRERMQPPAASISCHCLLTRNHTTAQREHSPNPRAILDRIRQKIQIQHRLIRVCLFFSLPLHNPRVTQNMGERDMAWIVCAQTYGCASDGAMGSPLCPAAKKTDSTVQVP